MKMILAALAAIALASCAYVPAPVDPAAPNPLAPPGEQWGDNPYSSIDNPAARETGRRVSYRAWEKARARAAAKYGPEIFETQ